MQDELQPDTEKYTSQYIIQIRVRLEGLLHITVSGTPEDLISNMLNCSLI